MRRWPRRLIIIAVIVGGLYVAAQLFEPSVTLRYRLTVAVAVDGVTHIGSGVVKVTYQSLPEWFVKLMPVDWSSRGGGTLTGSAITVDLGDRGLLFVVNSRPLFANTNGYRALPYGVPLDLLPFIAYRSLFPPDAQELPESGPPPVFMKRARMIRDAKRAPMTIPVEYLPMLVRFTNIADRGSIKEVDPRDLGAAYGPGVHLIGVTFELTNDAVTALPSRWPAWLTRESHTYLRFAQQNVWPGAGIYTDAFKGDSP